MATTNCLLFQLGSLLYISLFLYLVETRYNDVCDIASG